MVAGRENNSLLYEYRLNVLRDEVTVYPVSCENLSAGRTDYQWLDAVLAGGAKIVQLRDKLSSDRELLAKAKYFRARTSEVGALFIVNDRFDIALLADADGVHVGQGDLPAAEIRKLAPDWIIGLSCNNKDHIKNLQDAINRGERDVSYYNIGPVYDTTTKENLPSSCGPSELRSLSAECELPFTIIGGIKFADIDELVAAGASRIAVVTAISKADDIASETRKWVQKIESCLNKCRDL